MFQAVIHIETFQMMGFWKVFLCILLRDFQGANTKLWYLRKQQIWCVICKSVSEMCHPKLFCRCYIKFWLANFWDATSSNAKSPSEIDIFHPGPPLPAKKTQRPNQPIFPLPPTRICQAKHWNQTSKRKCSLWSMQVWDTWRLGDSNRTHRSLLGRLDVTFIKVPKNREVVFFLKKHVPGNDFFWVLFGFATLSLFWLPVMVADDFSEVP